MTFKSSDIHGDLYYYIPAKPSRLPIIQYDISKHNSNNIQLPCKRNGAIAGVTITSVPILSINNDDCKEYIAKTLNDEMAGFIPHYYCCIRSVWNILDESMCWQRKNAIGQQNDRILIAITSMDNKENTIPIPPMYNMTPLRDAANIAAHILYRNKLRPTDIKYMRGCTDFIASNWKEFKRIVKERYVKLGGKL